MLGLRPSFVPASAMSVAVGGTRSRTLVVVLRDTQRDMSDANIAVVRGAWEAFLRGDLETALACFDSDVEWDGTNLPDGQISRGRDAVVDHLARWAEMWEVWEVELEDVIDAGHDRVIAFIRERGRSKAGLEVNELH